jgi:hypothetical protein
MVKSRAIVVTIFCGCNIEASCALDKGWNQWRRRLSARLFRLRTMFVPPIEAFMMEHSQLSSNFSYWTSTVPSRLSQPNVVDHASASRCLRERLAEAATPAAFAAYLLR